MLIDSQRLLEVMRRSLSSVVRPQITSADGLDVLNRVDLLLAELVQREAGGRLELLRQIRGGQELLNQGVLKCKRREHIEDLPQSSSFDLQINENTSWTALAESYGRILSALEGLIEANSDDVGREWTTFIHSVAKWELAFAVPQPSRWAERPSLLRNAALTCESWQNYLDRRKPQCVPHRVSSVERIPGGYSKSTWLVVYAPANGPSEKVVVRMNQVVLPGSTACFLLDNEFALVDILLKVGFSVPRLLWFEADATIWGGAFTVTAFAPGKNAGDVMGSGSRIPEIKLRELAAGIASLHRIRIGPVSDSLERIFGVGSTSQTIEERNRAIVEANYNLWLRVRSGASPSCQRAFRWLLRNVPHDTRSAVLIHGDMGFHNVLFDGDALKAVLDWETAQIGDPAADLGAVRAMVEPHISWTRFLAFYREAGGLEVTEASIRFHGVAVWLKNAFRTAISAGLFNAGQRDNIRIAALATSMFGPFLQKVGELVEEPAVVAEIAAGN